MSNRLRSFGDRWKEVGKLDRGGQAATFLVNEVSDPKSRAVLKELSTPKNPQRVERFRREVAALQKLDHQNVSTILDAAVDTKPYFFVMPYYAGGSLTSAHVYDQDVGRIFDLFGQICDGVKAAHDAKIIHRDLKPDNIFLYGDERGAAVVGDFGLCLMEDELRLTNIDEVVGSRWYTAPELAHGQVSLEQAGPTCDIYSLGKTLYWMLSGGRIFDREDYLEDRWNLATMNGYLEHVNRKLLARMIVKDPQGRFKSIDEFRHDLPAIREMVVRESNSLDDGFPSICLFCRLGTYRRISKDHPLYYDLTRGKPKESYWCFLRCEECGNLQEFRADPDGTFTS